MKALAAFVMRGRAQAIMVASTLAVLALMITPLGIGSAAVIGLVTLRQGVREGLLVALASLLALGALGMLLFSQPLVLILMGAMLWAPLLLLGELLRVSRSLVFTVEAAVVAGFGLVLLQYPLLGDPVAFWAGILGEFLGQMADPTVFAEGDRDELIKLMAPWMVGALGAVWFLQLAVSLFLARWWQAQLYNPGGFGEEAYNLRFRRWLLILVPVILVLGSAGGDETNLAAQLSLVGISAFFIQGVTLVHALVNGLKASPIWLIGFYIVLVVGMPPSFTAVSAAGFADGWLNFRAKLRSRPDKDQDS